MSSHTEGVAVAVVGVAFLVSCGGCVCGWAYSSICVCVEDKGQQ